MESSPGTWIADTRQFLLDVRTEFRKVTWPSQKEAMAGTIGVLVIVTVITLALSLVDMALGQAIQLILP